MTLDELSALKTAVNDEIKLNHSTDSDINHFVQLLTKNRVEQYLLAQGLEHRGHGQVMSMFGIGIHTILIPQSVTLRMAPQLKNLFMLKPSLKTGSM